jgi:hypothetical protein
MQAVDLVAMAGSGRRGFGVGEKPLMPLKVLSISPLTTTGPRIERGAIYGERL